MDQTNQHYMQAELLTLLPTMDVIETDLEMSLCMKMPGVEKDAISIQVNQNILEVHGQILAQQSNASSKRPVGRYSRSFRLSDSVDASKIAAKMESGSVTLTLPKITEATMTPSSLMVH
ncbi:MAG: hypothetical protein COB67_01855 [SAR324 cluster bacterium]|uniref:SHSP domain-containing protein n=1 Tax=SAR324 cluster bacterium TaxID=2024889 RepID=A0A2A4T9W1_9DELT|nr:MAG: hypothetical protein COB67_01855 [SAR324 cluster bacterium]